MIEFMTPYDIMKKFVDVIEKQRVRKNMTQSDLYKASRYKASEMSSKAYANFMSSKSTKFENIVNIMIAPDMTSKLENLITLKKFTSIDEIRNEKKHKEKKRVRKG